MENCIFCKIIAGEISSEKVFESDSIIAFNDINPKAKIHILVLPKKHIISVKDLQESDKVLAGELFLAVQKIAKEKNMEGYKLAVNVGRKGGQIVDHLHIHLLSSDFSFGI